MYIIIIIAYVLHKNMAWVSYELRSPLLTEINLD